MNDQVHPSMRSHINNFLETSRDVLDGGEEQAAVREETARQAAAEKAVIDDADRVKRKADAQKLIDDEAARTRAEANALALQVVADPVPTNADLVATGRSFVAAYAAETAQEYSRAPCVDSRPPITTGALCQKARVTMTTEFIQSLGFSPAERPAASKNGTYWADEDVPLIFADLSKHFAELAVLEYMEKS